MAGDGTLEGGEETGGALRQKLEEALGVNSAIRSALADEVAGQFSHVSPEDLKDVAPDQFKAHAAEIQSTRETERQQVVTEALKTAGMGDEQIAKVLAGESAGAAPPPPVTEQLGALGGQPVSTAPDTSDLSPGAKIATGIAARSQRS